MMIKNTRLVGASMVGLALFAGCSDDRLSDHVISQAIMHLRRLATAQSKFKRTDWYGTGRGTYARRARHLYQCADRSPKYIDKELYQAFGPDGKGRIETGAVPKYGYLFVDLTPAADGPVKHYTYCAYPAEYGKTGRQTFVINQEGSVYGRDLGGKRVDAFPEDLSRWVAAGD